MHFCAQLHASVLVCVCLCANTLRVWNGLCRDAVWRSRVEIAWHMHHRGDSVGEGGSQAVKKKKNGERERECDGEKRQERREKRQRRE